VLAEPVGIGRESFLVIGQRPDLVVPALIGTLQEQDLRLSACSAWALSNFGDRATSAVPVIQALLEGHTTNELDCVGLREALKKFKQAATVKDKVYLPR